MDKVPVSPSSTEREAPSEERQADLIATCESLLADAKAGSVLQLFVVVEAAQGQTQTTSVYLNHENEYDRCSEFVSTVCCAVSEIIDLGIAKRPTVPPMPHGSSKPH